MLNDPQWVFFQPRIFFLSHNAEYAFRVYLAQFQHTVRDILTEENPFNGLQWGKYIKNIVYYVLYLI